MTRKEFMDKFFDLCKEAQEEIPEYVIDKKVLEIIQIGWIR